MNRMKRVVPLVMAAIVLAGTLLGLLAAVTAHAVSDGAHTAPGYMTIRNIEMVDKNGDKVEELERGVRYTMRVHVTVTPEGMKKKVLSHAGDGPTVTMRLRPENFDVDGLGSTPNYRFKHDIPSSDNEADKDNKNLCVVSGITNSDTGETQERHTLYLEDVYPTGNVLATDITVDYKSVDGVDESTPLQDPFPGKPVQGSLVSNISTGGDSGYGGGSTRNTSSDDEDGETVTTPKMIITNFEAPDLIEPDEDFSVTIEFLNNSKSKKMENVSMSVTPPEGATIKNDTNKRHYITIPKRMSTSETFTFHASKELKSEAIALTVKFEYQYLQDGAYKDATSEEIISIAAVPKEEEEKDKESSEGSISSFEILSVIPPEALYPNEDGYVTVKVINKDHQYDASNVQLSITGEGLLNNGNTEYHGALAHSTQAEIESAVQFAEPGTYTLEAIVTYEDSTGKNDDGTPIVRINDLKKEFTVTVSAPPEQPAMGGDMMGGGMGPNGEMLDENGNLIGPPPAGGLFGLSMPVLLCIGGGVLLGVVIITVVVIRKIRKKKAAEDEDL